MLASASSQPPMDKQCPNAYHHTDAPAFTTSSPHGQEPLHYMVRQDDDSGTLSDWPPTLGISNLSGAWSQQSPAMGSEPNWLQRQA
ncbi:hypothetical protein PtA15_9A501 [Puccinia triticina]|uniref:Uncharacterized protein n=1 Tax=Puccinia triticina TaxID=208348 RepID=A0ABY7CUR8_9BASI|nr:uncharacterized protein PtA15_9A501 [Puccinia triticina]WAQ88374.1 hypothetical protein PtA15_9A501 [Puccinia triticina]